MLADARGELPLICVAEFERVLADGIAQIVFERPHRLESAVVAGAAPTLRFGETDLRKVHRTTDHVLHAQLALPVSAGNRIAAGIGRE